MAVWRVQTNTGGANISAYCLEKSIIAMGWSLSNNNASEREKIHTFQDYCTLANEVYDQYNSVSRLAQEVNENDLVWMRSNGKYYLARVRKESNWLFCSSEEAQQLDASNQMNNIRWYPATANADEDSVPGAVTTAFIAGSTLQRIQKAGVEVYSQMLFNQIHDYSDDPYKYETEDLELNQENFFSLLQPDDAEDLLCMWLYKTKGYICIPSTNKNATPKYECVLIDPNNGKHIYIQVKKGNVDLDAHDYAALNGDVYLLTTQGTVKNAASSKNIFIVSPRDIFLFAIDSQYKNLIPESILRWIGFLSEHKGIMFDTNLSFSKNNEDEMLSQSRICAYGDAQRYVRSFRKGDYVLYYSRGLGIVAIGKIISSKPMQLERDDGLYHRVDLIVPKNQTVIRDTAHTLSANEIKQILGRNFYFASTIKTPFLNVDQVQQLISQLEKKYK